MKSRWRHLWRKEERQCVHLLKNNILLSGNKNLLSFGPYLITSLYQSWRNKERSKSRLQKQDWEFGNKRYLWVSTVHETAVFHGLIVMGRGCGAVAQLGLQLCFVVQRALICQRKLTRSHTEGKEKRDWKNTEIRKANTPLDPLTWFISVIAFSIRIGYYLFVGKTGESL